VCTHRHPRTRPSHLTKANSISGNLFHSDPEARPVIEATTGLSRNVVDRVIDGLSQAGQGQTPDDVFFGIGDEVTKKLADARESAREKRMKQNRAAGCGVCVGEANSGASLLQRPRSRMS
jgi:hypothetical protein